MKLVITVDVEEDQWGITAPHNATAHNVRRLPTLQRVLDEFGIIPTYLLTYPVVTDPHAVAILRGIMEGGGCEVGAHCHPWNTPPYEESLNTYNSMLCNLPATLQFDKLQQLHGAIQNHSTLLPSRFEADAGDSMRKWRGTSCGSGIASTRLSRRTRRGPKIAVRIFRMSPLSPLWPRRSLPLIDIREALLQRSR